ncbi:MAG: hypothetical protein AAGF11_01305 [Myxococcota bacterium]
MRAIPNRHLALHTLVALCCVLAPTGCDKGESSDEKGKASTPSAEGDTKDAEPSEDAKGAGAEGGEAKLSDKDAEIAALKAELAAAQEQLEAAKEIDPEAAKQLDEAVTLEDDVAHEKKLEAGQEGPVSVANVSFDEKKPLFGDGGLRFELAADVTVNEKKEGGVYAKASCLVGEEVFVNVGTISNNYGDLGKMKEGETRRLQTHLFSSGLPGKPTRCQLAFDYGAPVFSTRVSDVCWDGKAIVDGACKEPVLAQPKGAGKIVPFTFAVAPHKSIFNAKPDDVALNVSYGARFNAHIEKAPHLHTKTACKVGDQIWVEVSPDFPHVKPFSLENGEAVMVHHNQFFTNALPGNPEACNIEVLLDGGLGKSGEKLAEVCAKAGTVAPSKCEFRTEPQGSPGPVESGSISIDRIAFEWGNDWSDKSKVVLRVQLAATVHKGIAERVQLTAMANCDGKDDEEHHIGPDLEYIGPGETVGVNFAAFRSTPLDAPSGRCEVIFGAKPFMARGEGVELAKFCLKGDKVTAGKCKGKKGKAIGVGQEVVFAGGKANKK